MCSLLSVILVSGCASPARAIFEPLAQPLVWPGPPDPERIEYIGEIRTERDLRPGRSLGEALSDVIFGRREIQSMLTPFAVAGDDDRSRGMPPSRIFVCDSNAQLVHVFNLATRRYEQWRPAKEHARFAQPVGIAFDQRHRRLLVADPVVGGVYIFERDGRGAGWIGEAHLGRPTGIAVDSERERIYIADTEGHHVTVLDTHGELVATIGERGSGAGTFNFPTNVAIDGNGRLYVSDSLNFRIQVFDAEFRHLGQIGQRGNRPGHFSQPRGVAVDRHGHIYIIDAHFEAVQIFDAEGRLLLSFGEEGRGPGQFWLPTGIYIGADDRIWVADSYNRRVQVFQYREAVEMPRALPSAPEDVPEVAP